ncbi:hypothetical protein PENARI_c003G09342 [Penicillium arizonense]|uniref:tRNA dimethylallyltransferase n=1 Tax=Penicillium arizonense TaxID=1835702 RepID=A0A1F5LT11_PENAI|nr:hypothetical protein PENARI_c003G09342 [Penicillium arizonense]OGE56079.1 hypothetical protein PENARI_c003G09342 [Penicillium arizonense]
MDPLIAVVGATGTGKSKLAVDLASRFNGEIINGDAMQMYRGLPIITNQIPVDERNGIPHHLLSCIDLDAEAWRIGNFKREALRLIEDIRSRGKLPILVGGTHYYTQAVLFKDQLVGEGADEEGEPEPGKELESTSQKWPILDAEPEIMLEKLREVDPVMAARWHPRDGRKIRRSLEIYLKTGRPASEIYKKQMSQKEEAVQKEEGLLRFNTLVFWVHAEKKILNARLDARVDDMVEQGLMCEAQKMSDYIHEKQSQGVEVDQTRGVWVSIGFKELAPYFEAVRNGDLSEKELENLRRTSLESIRTATRQYGTSQVKWIRNKLWRALSESGKTRCLYLLDSSNVSEWKNCITEPSEQLVQKLLQNEPTPDPKSLSELATAEFSAKEAQGRVKAQTEILKCYTCDHCKKTMSGEDQWNIHINGHPHRRVLRAAKKKAQRDAYFRQKEMEEKQSHIFKPDS